MGTNDSKPKASCDPQRATELQTSRTPVVGKSLMSKNLSTCHTGIEGGDSGCICASTPQEHKKKSVAGAAQWNRGKKRGELIKGCAI